MLAEFVEWFNSSDGEMRLSRNEEAEDDYISAVQESFHQQFLRRTPRTRIGVSELGKPAVILALKQLGFRAEQIKMPSLINFHYGDWFEAFIICMMEHYGIEVYLKQSSIHFEQFEGHLDGYADEHVIEVKTMSGWNFDKFLKEPHDDNGYVTQLSIYSTVLKQPGAWLLFNKETRELALKKPDESQVMDAVERAKALAAALADINTIEAMFYYFDAPEPVAEYNRKKFTGNYKVPESMKYCPYREAFYVIERRPNAYKKETEYVVDLREEEEAIGWLYGKTKAGE